MYDERDLNTPLSLSSTQPKPGISSARLITAKTVTEREALDTTPLISTSVSQARSCPCRWPLEAADLRRLERALPLACALHHSLDRRNTFKPSPRNLRPLGLLCFSRTRTGGAPCTSARVRVLLQTYVRVLLQTCAKLTRARAHLPPFPRFSTLRLGRFLSLPDTLLCSLAAS